MTTSREAHEQFPTEQKLRLREVRQAGLPQGRSLLLVTGYGHEGVCLGLPQPQPLRHLGGSRSSRSWPRSIEGISPVSLHPDALELRDYFDPSHSFPGMTFDLEVSLPLLLLIFQMEDARGHHLYTIIFFLDFGQRRLRLTLKTNDDYVF